MKSRFHEIAEAELADAVAYYESRATDLGEALLSEVKAAVAHIEAFPESSTEIEFGIRRKVLAKFPYDLFYAFDGIEVVILALAHESRRPGFWRGRKL